MSRFYKLYGFSFSALIYLFWCFFQIEIPPVFDDFATLNPKIYRQARHLTELKGTSFQGLACIPIVYTIVRQLGVHILLP
jgi:hypothetical protein